MSTDTTFRVAISKHQLAHKIPAGDAFWSTFNAGFANREVSQLDLADAIYTGHSFTTWHAKNWRTSANYLCGQHIGLDFDTEDDRSTLTTLCADKFIAKYASLIYTTTSHTPEAPRARVVFLLDMPIMQAKNYAQAVQALLWLFGTADRQCKDPVRFFYGATGCEIAYLENVLSLDTVKHLIQQWSETGRREKRTVEHRDFTAPTTQAEVYDALKRIPPWGVDYDEWVQVLMGLQAGFGEDGLTMAETWADGAPGEVERKWRSFHEQGNPTGAVTIATVFGIAKRFGWQKAA
jgi:hypothetical protein